MSQQKKSAHQHLPLSFLPLLWCMQAGGAHAPCEEPACFTHQRPDFQPRPLHVGLQLAPDAVLDESPRRRCPGCDRSNAYYCCDCLLPMTAGVPAVRLPFNLFVCVGGPRLARLLRARCARAPLAEHRTCTCTRSRRAASHTWR